jgi:hypothetical protein
MKIETTLSQLYGLVTWWITAAVSLGLLMAISAAVAAVFGLRVPGVPAIDPSRLAWLCGAWWLYRGGKL